MRIMDMRARWGLSAGWQYSSGAGHYSWDIPTPTGTELHMDVAGTVADCADGVTNNNPGYNPGSGAPSNWILLHTQWQGRTVTVFVNHLSPGLAVSRGQRIAAGAYCGRTGNSGNSTGPHTHVTTYDGALSGPDRYAYLDNPRRVIWEPDRVLTANTGEEPEMITDDDCERIANAVWSLQLSASNGQAAHTVLREARDLARTAAGQAAAVMNWDIPISGGGHTDFWAMARGTYEQATAAAAGVADLLKRGG